MMGKEEKVTPITYDCKRLLLEVLTRGYITDEQKARLADFFNVEQTQLVYVTTKDNLQEIRRLYNEISEEARKKGVISDVLTTFDEMKIYGEQHTDTNNTD
jgi:uncharacterized protein YpuA (DUF1002 family)|nr:MAG TPA: hypothetical protein [Caudoviricetes sp.]